MATTKKPAESAAEQTESVASVPVKAESVYSAEELAHNYKAFHTSREIVSVALRLAGKTAATYPEAKTIIDNFKNKEVKG